jgi:hypothetical protein
MHRWICRPYALQAHLRSRGWIVAAPPAHGQTPSGGALWRARRPTRRYVE